MAAVTDLMAAQNADGGWGAAPDAVSNAECTALGCLALATAAPAHPEAVRAGYDWLLARQLPSGAWPFVEGAAHAVWPTPLAVLALRAHEPAAPARTRALEFLLTLRGEQAPLRHRIREWLSGRQAVEVDTTLNGWPWVPGTFAWVEPTAWAMLALKASWPAGAPRVVRRRLRDAERMMADRACVGGGWNYGNRRVLEENLPPYPDTTAIALLGLHGQPSPKVEEGFVAMHRLLGEHASRLALSLAVLAHRAWGRDATALHTRLAGSLDAGEVLADNRGLALAILALAPSLHWLGVRLNA